MYYVRGCCSTFFVLAPLTQHQFFCQVIHSRASREKNTVHSTVQLGSLSIGITIVVFLCFLRNISEWFICCQQTKYVFFLVAIFSVFFIYPACSSDFLGMRYRYGKKNQCWRTVGCCCTNRLFRTCYSSVEFISFPVRFSVITFFRYFLSSAPLGLLYRNINFCQLKEKTQKICKKDRENDICKS